MKRNRISDRVIRWIILPAVMFLASCAGNRSSSDRDPVVDPTPPEGPVIWVNFTTNEDPVKTLAMDGDTLWIGTMKGIIRFDTKKREYEIFSPNNTNGGLASRGIFMIAVDRRGRKWVGSYGGGLSRFDGEEWVRYTNADGLGDNWVYDVEFDRDGKMWIATWDGVSVYDGKSFMTYRVADGLPDKWVYTIALDRDGVFWFGTEAGVSRFDRISWTTYTHEEGMGTKIKEVPGGQAVFSPIPSGEGGERGYGGSGGNHHMTSGKQNVTANPDFIIASLVDRRNEKWFGTWGGGLARFDGTRWLNYTTEDGLGGNFIFSLGIDSEGFIWAGTNGGASWFDGTRWRTIDHSFGLPDDNVLSMAFDREGRRWFGTRKGVSVFKGHIPLKIASP